MKDALTIHRALLEREIQHEIVRLPIAISRSGELPGALGLPSERCLATRVFACNDVYRSRRFLTAAIVPAGSEPSAEAARLAVSARLIRPARADLINTVTEYAADLVCPLLLPDSVRVLIDRTLVESLPVDDVVYTATGEPSTALGIRALDLFALSRAEPVHLCDWSAPHASAVPLASMPSVPSGTPAPSSGRTGRSRPGTALIPPDGPAQSAEN
ncbi:aminoacyl-tRNA deacylase [Actinomadura sp. SCN-SB]|uniref:aminoacyl-tRNA deacylase n=1 Tax=Actinomadura sp. SCN-SB TaxID=3373092 RepID=UPI003750E20E